MFIRGDITGCGSLLIEGRVQGTIRLDDNRVTVGRDANVDATIVARDVLVLGRIRGSINAAVRAEIRAEGAVTGDVVSPRIVVELGASLQSDIDTRKLESAADCKGMRTAPIRTNLDRTNLDHIPLDRIQPMPASMPIGVKSAREGNFERERVSAG
jgi:cytoskeletal protein CcmA (bactofilin family)